LVSDSAQVKAFDAVFASVFGTREPAAEFEPDDVDTAAAAEPSAASHSRREAAVGAGSPSSAPSGSSEEDVLREVAVPMAASDEEVLRSKRFDALGPGELAQLYGLMARLEVATPRRRTRRSKRDRRGDRMDMRRTLRGSMRTAGDPIRLARRRTRGV